MAGSLARGKTTLVLMAGFGGSGKSESGKLWAASTGWALLDKDTLTRPFVERLLEVLGGDPDDRDTQFYVENVRPLEYECLMKAIWENLECGNSVVAVAPFIYEVVDARWMSRVSHRCDSMGVRLETFWVESDEGTMHDRLTTRSASRDTWKLANWSTYTNRADFTVKPALEYQLIDNRHSAVLPLAEQVEAAAHRVLSGAA